MEKLSTEKEKTENSEGSEDDRTEFESDHRVAEKPDGERLKIDEESLAAEIRWIEKLETMCFESMESVDTISGLIRVKTDRDGFEMVDAKKKSEEEKCDECERERKVRSQGLPHKKDVEKNI